MTALNPFIGYEAAAAVAHEALETGQTIRDVVIERGHVARGELTEAQLDTALDVLAMTWPPGARLTISRRVPPTRRLGNGPSLCR